MLSPSAPALARPCTNASRPAAESSDHSFANSSLDMPATSAKPARDSPPSRTAASIFFMPIVMAVPPASASMPTEDMAAARPSTSPSVRPSCAPIPDRRIPIAMISPSVVAKLLPRPTRVEPSRSTSFWLVPMMFENRAREVAASSADRLVVSPRLIMVRVNFTTESVSTPSCPAASATAAISWWEAGSSRARPRSPSSTALSCAGEPSTVLSTPAHDDSQSIDAFAAMPRPAAAAVPTPRRLFETRSKFARCAPCASPTFASSPARDFADADACAAPVVNR